jgi:hypothetical protein
VRIDSRFPFVVERASTRTDSITVSFVPLSAAQVVCGAVPANDPAPSAKGPFLVFSDPVSAAAGAEAVLVLPVSTHTYPCAHTHTHTHTHTVISR